MLYPYRQGAGCAALIVPGKNEVEAVVNARIKGEMKFLEDAGAKGIYEVKPLIGFFFDPQNPPA